MRVVVILYPNCYQEWIKCIKCYLGYLGMNCVHTAD